MEMMERPQMMDIFMLVKEIIHPVGHSCIFRNGSFGL